MIIVKGGVTAAKGFVANGIAAGIKMSGRKDLGLLYSEVPAVAAGAFTTNRFQGSPVKISKAHLENRSHQAIIVNSGNANCANGKIGERHALSMADFVAEGLALERENILVASTGIIGKHLPIEKIKKQMPYLIEGLSKDNGASFAEAILTTDTEKKEFAVKLRLGNASITIGGACKGSGMICPDIRVVGHATMLVFITTDVAITKKMLRHALQEAIDESFNMISIDRDMSTNDSCFIFANGLAGNRLIDSKNESYELFSRALKFVTMPLAKMLVKDGEGATKFVEINVAGARNYKDARKIARSISASTLLKCCIYGEDPNWGRVAAACGASGVDFNPNRVDIYLGNVKVMSNGTSVRDYDKKSLKSIFKRKDITIKVDLKTGAYSATAWTCDLSKKYIDINAEYST